MNPTYDYRLPRDPIPARRPGTYPTPPPPSDWYALSKDVQSYVAALNASIALKQDLLVSGTNIKTVNGQSLLGSGNVSVNAAHASTHASTGTDPVTPESIGAVASSYVTTNLMQRKSANDVDTNFMLLYQRPGQQTMTNVLHYDTQNGYGWYFNGIAANALVGYYLRANGSPKYLQLDPSTGRPGVSSSPGGTAVPLAYLSEATSKVDKPETDTMAEVGKFLRKTLNGTEWAAALEASSVVTQWQGAPDDVHLASEKLVKDSLDGCVKRADFSEINPDKVTIKQLAQILKGAS